MMDEISDTLFEDGKAETDLLNRIAHPAALFTVTLKIELSSAIGKADARG